MVPTIKLQTTVGPTPGYSSVRSVRVSDVPPVLVMIAWKITGAPLAGAVSESLKLPSPSASLVLSTEMAGGGRTTVPTIDVSVASTGVSGQDPGTSHTSTAVTFTVSTLRAP